MICELFQRKNEQFKADCELCLLKFDHRVTVIWPFGRYKCYSCARWPLNLLICLCVSSYAGTVPGPIIFGKLIDNACMIWEYECDGQQTCWLYDNGQFARSLFLVLFIGRAVSISSFCGSLFFYKPISEAESVDEKGPAAVIATDTPEVTKQETMEKGTQTAWEKYWWTFFMSSKALNKDPGNGWGGVVQRQGGLRAQLWSPHKLIVHSWWAYEEHSCRARTLTWSSIFSHIYRTV